MSHNFFRLFITEHYGTREKSIAIVIADLDVIVQKKKSFNTKFFFPISPDHDASFFFFLSNANDESLGNTVHRVLCYLST